MQIKSIHIQNFQSHRDTFIEFDKGVNAIIGQTDVGKSAIMRAFDFVFNDKPAGNAFMSWWGGDTCVTVTFFDGTVIKRTKGSVNEYQLHTSDGKDFKLDGFGKTGVPKVVQDAAMMFDFNFGFQHQGAFLLSNKSGDVSRYLNKIAKLDIIDRAISNIDSTIRRERQSLEAEETTIERLTTELQKYDHLEDMEKDLLAVELLEKQLSTESARYNSLFDWVEEAKKTEGMIIPFENILQAKSSWKQISILINEINQVANKQSKLLLIKTQIQNDTKKEQTLREVLQYKKSVRSIESQVNIYNQTKVQRDKIAQLIASIKGVRLKEAQTNLEALKKEYEQTFPDVCPLCGAVKHVHS